MSKLLRWPVALVLLATTALAIDITTPGQTIPRGDTGTLQADLSCTPSAVGVFLDNGATLAMNGHVLDGCFVAEAGLSPVNIRVEGPGLIRNAGIQIRQGRLSVRGVDIQDAPSVGILGSPDANDGPSKLRLRDVTVTRSGLDGIRGTQVMARDVTSSFNGVGPFPGVIGWGIIGWAKVNARHVVVITNNAEGVFSNGKLTLRDSQVSGNKWGGVVGTGAGSGALTVIGSTVTQNATLGEADLVSQRRPRVKFTVCGTSLDAQALVPWGVCSND